MEKNENREAGNADAAKGRIHSFHRVNAVTFLKDLIEYSPKFSLRSGALRALGVDEARRKTGHRTLDALLHTRITAALPYKDTTSFGSYNPVLGLLTNMTRRSRNAPLITLFQVNKRKFASFLLISSTTLWVECRYHCRLSIC